VSTAFGLHDTLSIKTKNNREEDRFSDVLIKKKRMLESRWIARKQLDKGSEIF
jgi:hypothetical protein